MVDAGRNRREEFRRPEEPRLGGSFMGLKADPRTATRETPAVSHKT
jgi:hypothetical protein